MKPWRLLRVALWPLALARSRPTSFVGRAQKVSAKTTALVIRGGDAGLINAKAMVQTTAVVNLAQGLMMTLGPKQSNEQTYGLQSEFNDVVQQLHCKLQGTGILSSGVMLYTMFFQDLPLSTALLRSNLLWAYESTRDILNGDVERRGYNSDVGIKFAVAIFLFTAFAMTQQYAGAVIKATSMLWFLCGFHCLLATESTMKLWNYCVVNDRTKANFREFGVFLVSTTILSGSLTLFPEFVTPTQAAGYSAIPWLVHFVRYIQDGTCAKYGVDQSKAVFWILYHVLYVATTLAS